MPPSEQSIARGAGMVVAATAAFAMLDAGNKYLSAAYAVSFFVAVRYAVNLLLVVAIFAPREGWAMWRTKRTGLVLLRGLCLLMASLIMGFALRFIPLGEAVAILYVSPLFVVMAAVPLLGEPLRKSALFAAVLGFAGVILIARPGSGLSLLGVSLVLVTAMLNGAYQLLSRELAKTETTLALVLWSALMGTVAFGVTLPWTLPAQMPGLWDSAVLVGLGVMATAGHMLFTAAYRVASASALAPLNYFHLIWAGILGWLFFDHMPDVPALIGMAMVAGGGVVVAVANRRPEVTAAE